jgi:hypothetical protein
MQYLSCRGCLVDRHNCETRKAISTAIKGLRVTSLKFDCAERLGRFRAGQRVTVMWKFLSEDSDGLDVVAFKATVLKEHKPGRLHIRVDDGPCHDCEGELDDYIAPGCLIGNGYATATYSRLQAIAEPDVPICETCGGMADGQDCFSLKNNSCLIYAAKEGAE